MKAMLLLLEDDHLLSETIQDFLEEEGFEVVIARNGQEALDYTYRYTFDAYLLDINVPLINGLELLEELRQADDNTPAIFLTSYQDKATMREGFASGADDYVKKPVDPDELLMRIRALLRRSKGVSKHCIGALCLDETHKSATLQGRRLELTLKEYQLLFLLIQHADHVVTKEMIIDALWSSAETVSDGAIRVYINRLKNELGTDAIKNIRGIGYQFVSAV